MRDVCFQVYERTGKNKARGCWINIALGEPFIIGDHRGPAIEEIVIKDFTEWRRSDNPRTFKTSAQPG